MLEGLPPSCDQKLLTEQTQHGTRENGTWVLGKISGPLGQPWYFQWPTIGFLVRRNGKPLIFKPP